MSQKQALFCQQVIAGTEAPAVELKTTTTAVPASPSQEVANPKAGPKAGGGVSPPAKRKVHIVLPEPSPRPQAAGGRGGGPPGSHATGLGKAPPRWGEGGFPWLSMFLSVSVLSILLSVSLCMSAAVVDHPAAFRIT